MRGGGGGPLDPSPHALIFLEVGHGKAKPNRWLERSSKMRNLHRCHCPQKFSKYE